MVASSSSSCASTPHASPVASHWPYDRETQLTHSPPWPGSCRPAHGFVDIKLLLPTEPQLAERTPYAIGTVVIAFLVRLVQCIGREYDSMPRLEDFIDWAFRCLAE